MTLRTGGRFASAQAAWAAPGWTLERLTPPSRLYGANGLRTGPDGRLYVAQCVGSQISAIDIDSGAIEVVSAMGGEIVAPDDVAFDSDGSLYATEVMNARVSVRDVHGNTRVLRGDLPSANGITFHQGRLYIDECRPGGRLLELDLDGGEPRVLASDLPMPNALAPGPDGRLYFPLMGSDEIWRVGPDGGAPERVAGGLAHPVAVKFDAAGFIVSPQCASGEVLRIDPRSGAASVVARLAPGLDNLAFVGERLFVSHMTDGTITEIGTGGAGRTVLPGGLQFPLDMTTGADGAICFADNCVLYAIAPDGTLAVIGRLFDPGFPGTLRGIAASGSDAFAVSTTDGRVVLYRPSLTTHEVLAEGLDQVYGVVVSGGRTIVAERGAGRVLAIGPGGTEELAHGLDSPSGLAVGSDGAIYVSDSGAGRVVRLAGARTETVCDDLGEPQGIAVAGDTLYVLDAAKGNVSACDLQTGARTTIAGDLPVGAPPGVVPKPLRGFPPFSGPMGPFAGMALADDGAVCFSADGEGSVMVLRRAQPD